MAQLNNLSQSYDTGGHPINVFPQPIYLNRAPAVTDNAEVGSILINTVTNLAYICTDNALNNATWLEITQGGGGPGIFTTLTADGATNLNVGTANVFNVLTGASTGAVHINDGTGTGTIGIGNALAGAIDIISSDDITISSTLSAANSIVINASGAAGQTVIRSGTGGVLIGTDADTTTISLGDVVPTAARTVTLAGGTVGSAIADTVDIAPDGVNFAGSSKVVNIASGAVVAGTSTINIGTGNVTAAQVNTVNIATGTGTSDINIGTTATNTIDIQGVVGINTSINAAVNINTGTSTGTVTIGGAVASTINIGNIVPTSPRAITISGGIIGSAIADTLDLGSGGVNFAGSSRTTTLGNGAVTIGTNTVNIANGAVGASGVNDINIGGGAVTAGGATTIDIGNANAGTDVTVTTPATTVAGTGLGVVCGAGTEIKILAGAGDPTGATLAPQGSLYIKTDASSTTTRLWIATAANTWTFFTSNA